jgi:hypothetical protein
MEDRLLLQSEVAERLRVSETTVKRLRLSGQLAYLLSRPVKIKESALADYINRQRVPATQEPEPVAHEITTAEKAKRDDVLRAKAYWLRRRL